MFGLPLQLNANSMVQYIEKNTKFEDKRLVTHISKLLGQIKANDYVHTDIVHLSNITKQVNPLQNNGIKQMPQEIPVKEYERNISKGRKQYTIKNYVLDSQKLQWAGVNLGNEVNYIIQNQLRQVAETFRAKEVRFWGKILGKYDDYYIIQGIKETMLSKQQVPRGAEKNGEGINFYSFWVTNNIFHAKWIELPYITPTHIKISRQIKRIFTGILDDDVYSYPPFPGKEQHLLKAQIVRMTASLEIVPKGIYKVNDENPKITEFEEQVKVPEFADLSNLQNWVHRNQNILSLGRCTHYIDPATPEDQIQALTAQLAEKDPQIQRLKAVSEDKIPQSLNLGIENVWQLKVQGDNQIFSKEEAQLVYGVVVVKNIYWPGWINIGYKGGYSSIYVGNGLKAIQPSWSAFENSNLAEEADDLKEFNQPNPKQLPKAAQEVAVVEPVDQ